MPTSTAHPPRAAVAARRRPPPDRRHPDPGNHGARTAGAPAARVPGRATRRPPRPTKRAPGDPPRAARRRRSAAGRRRARARSTTTTRRSTTRRACRAEARALSDDLIVVMRVYFEKPRTTVGWKGFINDPHLDGSFRINEGLRLARRILLEINELGLPAGTEFLDLITPQYIADLIAGARSARAPPRARCTAQLASGLSCPVGFKNGTDGDVRIAADAIQAASRAARLPVGDQGRPLGDRPHRRQRGLPRHPARRQGAELRRGERRGGVQASSRDAGLRAQRDDRLLARQQPEAARAPGRRRARRRARRSPAATSASSA